MALPDTIYKRGCVFYVANIVKLMEMTFSRAIYHSLIAFTTIYFALTSIATSRARSTIAFLFIIKMGIEQ